MCSKVKQNEGINYTKGYKFKLFRLYECLINYYNRVITHQFDPCLKLVANSSDIALSLKEIKSFIGSDVVE